MNKDPNDPEETEDRKGKGKGIFQQRKKAKAQSKARKIAQKAKLEAIRKAEE